MTAGLLYIYGWLFTTALLTTLWWVEGARGADLVIRGILMSILSIPWPAILIVLAILRASPDEEPMK